MTAPSQRRLALILGALAGIGPFSIDMYLPALPALGASLNASPGAVQGTLAIYFLGLAFGQVLYGPLSDRHGRRAPLFVGLGLYTVAAIGCALAPDVESLTVARLFQALGGCAGMVIARAVVRDVTDERGAVRLMAQLMLVMGVAPIVAPMIGGALLPAFGWRGIFWLLVVYGAVMLGVLALFLPESLPPERRRREGVLGVMRTWYGLMRDRRFMGYALAGGFVIGGMFAYISGSPFVLMELHGVPASEYGFYFGANALGIMAMGQAIARLAQRMPPARLLPVVICVPPVAGLALLATTVSGIGGFPALVAALFCYVAMIGAVMPLTVALGMGPHGAVAGSASALMGTLQFGIGAAAGALLGLLQDGTAMPMALVIAGCGVAGWCSRRFLAP
ncbi:Bcr/CflA family multidrug efflux MFS transporter [Roseomonas terrae]|jgi:DHA1 family bicyclomycin/chloramphenicol resistance-like MFS transporter|uniref:Bcr/CflA family efflux transporter n=1 Tax=Neoroseomonas terrae TaxID=424799 RepID=A0ABS5EMW6_9PROT|nr:Bcr/CflA family multidrug efflux MFS transporter [Neoroseomonas terrae]MBR0652382.1 Bcr/CflA family multidrug efflux MFS transporter [Neoroseomonas terrae]